MKENYNSFLTLGKVLTISDISATFQETIFKDKDSYGELLTFKEGDSCFSKRVEHVPHNLEVGKTYVCKGGYVRFTVIALFNDYVWMSLNVECIPNKVYKISEFKNHYEYIPDRWVVLTYKDSTHTRAETSAETFPSEQAARDRSGSSPLFAGVAKLENNASSDT